MGFFVIGVIAVVVVVVVMIIIKSKSKAGPNMSFAAKIRDACCARAK